MFSRQSYFQSKVLPFSYVTEFTRTETVAQHDQICKLRMAREAGAELVLGTRYKVLHKAINGIPKQKQKQKK